MSAVAIVVPCYNEEDRLEPQKFFDSINGPVNVTFIFVDDGSLDDTRGVLGGIGAKQPDKVRAINLPSNMGKAEAVRQGVMSALDCGFEFVGYWDADLSTPLYELEEFMRIMASSSAPDIVLGSRVKLLGRNIQRRAVRHYLGRVFATCASITLNLSVYDTQCGAKLFRNTAPVRKMFEKKFMTGWIFDVEALARFLIASDGAAERIIEYPLREWADISGSKVGTKDFFKAFWDIWKIFIKYSSRLYKTKCMS